MFSRFFTMHSKTKRLLTWTNYCSTKMYSYFSSYSPILILPCPRTSSKLFCFISASASMSGLWPSAPSYLSPSHFLSLKDFLPFHFWLPFQHNVSPLHSVGVHHFFIYSCFFISLLQSHLRTSSSSLRARDSSARLVSSSLRCWSSISCFSSCSQWIR